MTLPADPGGTDDPINLYTADRAKLDTLPQQSYVKEYQTITAPEQTAEADLTKAADPAKAGVELLSSHFSKWSDVNSFVVCHNQTAGIWVIQGQYKSRVDAKGPLGVALIDDVTGDAVIFLNEYV